MRSHIEKDITVLAPEGCLLGRSACSAPAPVQPVNNSEILSTRTHIGIMEFLALVLLILESKQKADSLHVPNIYSQ